MTETPEGQTEPVTTKGLKSQWIAQIKASANSQLASTDWMVIRKAERDVAIPSDVVTARAAIIADCTAKEAAITAATTIEAFINVVAPVKNRFGKHQADGKDYVGLFVNFATCQIADSDSYGRAIRNSNVSSYV